MKPALIFIAAAISGCLIGGFGLLMTGAGHGWGSAAISAFAIFTTPAAAVAWFVRRHWGGLLFAGVLIVVNVVILVALYNASVDEGMSYATRSFEEPLVWAWAVLWGFWQLVPVAALISGIRIARSIRPKS